MLPLQMKVVQQMMPPQILIAIASPSRGARAVCSDISVFAAILPEGGQHHWSPFEKAKSRGV
jgi:hypothetical protein